MPPAIPIVIKGFVIIILLAITPGGINITTSKLSMAKVWMSKRKSFAGVLSCSMPSLCALILGSCVVDILMLASEGDEVCELSPFQGLMSPSSK